MKQSRLKIMAIPVDEIAFLLQGKQKITNLPTDVTIKHVYYEPRSECFEMILEHESFEKTKPGEQYPFFIAESLWVKP